MVAVAEILTAGGRVRNIFGQCVGESRISARAARLHARSPVYFLLSPFCRRSRPARNHRRTVAVGRWLTRDPIGVEGGVNLYEYAAGGGTSRSDPSGEKCHRPCESRAAFSECALEFMGLLAICVGDAIRTRDWGEIAFCYAAYLYSISVFCKPVCPCQPCKPAAGTICVSGRGTVAGPRRGQVQSVLFLMVVRHAPGGCKCELATFGNTGLSSIRQYPPCSGVSGGGMSY
jgi:hypothetical protein